ncbi:hypothetical protein ES705_39048 [subsurface metagenome]
MSKNSNSRVKIKESQLKILFAKSGNQCAFPGCSQKLIVNEDDTDKPLGEMAHMIAYSDTGQRGDINVPESNRNNVANLILLCPTHTCR